MGELICPKISAKKACFVFAVTALFFLFIFISSEIGRTFRSGQLEGRNSTGVIHRSGPMLSPEEIKELMKRRMKYTNRRLLIGEDCSKTDVSIFQGEMNPLPNGIPTFSVQIINLCDIGCPISNIHVSCGWFASAKLINPEIFRRLDFNDCLVNDGMPLDGGDSVEFEYSNSFQYPMRVERAVMCNRVVFVHLDEAQPEVTTDMFQDIPHTRGPRGMGGMETRHEFKSTTQYVAAHIRDLVTRRVGRSVVVSTRNRRFLASNQCSNKDISIIQSEEPNSGIPQYVVQIVNTCISDCAPIDIHVFCGWFASTPLVNPNYFKRLSYNDCLVNGGRPLSAGNVIQFQYANTFMYPMRFRSAQFC